MGGTEGPSHDPGHGAGLPYGDEERLEELFKQLDKDGNGRIDIQELSTALKDSGVHQTYAKVSLVLLRLRLPLTA